MTDATPTAWRSRIVGHDVVDPATLQANPLNFRGHPAHQREAMEGVLDEIGWIQDVIVNRETGLILDGHLRVALAIDRGEQVPVKYVALSAAEEALALLTFDPISALAVTEADNLDVLQAMVETENEAILALLDDLQESAIDDLPGETETALDVATIAPPDLPDVITLAERFLIPPFSVLDARRGPWQDRKRAWISLGIRSELGRGENSLGFSDRVNEAVAPKSRRGAIDQGGGLLLGSEHVADRDHYRRQAGKRGKKATAQALSNGATIGSGLSDQMSPEIPRRRGKKATAETFGMIGDPATQIAEFRAPYKEARKPSGRLTFATGNERTDEVSKRIVAAGAKMGGRPPHGAHVSRNPDGTLNYEPTNAPDGASSGTSIFDPVLCELAYRWFCPPGGAVLDPFAGGSVRGITASRLGRYYTGIDLSAPQVEANRDQAAAICEPDLQPIWHVGDSLSIPAILGESTGYDFVLSCPPYADLEVYSDNPADLSTMDYEDFRPAYWQIIAHACDRLADDRFALWVVGDVRDPAGNYRNFVSDTIAAFLAAGLHLYNEAILVTAVGSLPIRVGRQFETGRKLGKTHQNVLVFVKGDAKRATQAIGPVDLSDDLFADAPTLEEATDA